MMWPLTTIRDRLKRGPPGAQAFRAIGNAALAHHYRVALVDLDSRIPGLGRVARGLSRTQRFFGFSASRQRTPAPARKTSGGRPQLYIDGVPGAFYASIAPSKVDFTVCLTDRMIAFREKKRVVNDYISAPSPVDERVMFVSHALIGEHARRAVVSYETAVAFVVTAQLVAHFFHMNYHDETRNCPMDFCDNLDDLVGGLIAGRFCPSCARHLSRNPDLDAAARAMIGWGR